MLFSSVLLGLGSLVSIAAADLGPLTIKGSKFFNPDGSQFFIKGIAYQLTPEDPLTDASGAQCALDAKLMSSIGANAIRVYHVDASASHAVCMKAFSDNGIYTFIDLDTFSTQIEQDGPPHWNSTQLGKFTDVLDTFAPYKNAAGFFIGNEIITYSNGSWAAPYIKAAVRDVKAHIKTKTYGKDVYIGYSAADISELRPNLQNYLVCGSDNSQNVDFFGLNAYEWCGKSDFVTSGYQALYVNSTEYPVPIFFSETGCNKPAPRDFADQGAILGKNMSDTWSGAIVYEYLNEANQYGLITFGKAKDPTTAVGGDIYNRGGIPTPVQPDFDNLKAAWAAVTPTGVSMNAYSSTNPAPTCPPETIGVWNVNAAIALPSLGQTASSADATAAATGSPTTTGGKSTSTPKSGAAELFINVKLSIFVTAVLGAVALL